MAKKQENSPEMITAQAKLLDARTKQAEVQMKYQSNNLQNMLAVRDNARSEEAHILDQGLKRTEQAAIFNDIAGQREDRAMARTQSLAGRPQTNFQGAGEA